MAAKRRHYFPGGCIFVVTLVVFACALLVGNGLLVSLFFPAVSRTAKAWLHDEKYAAGLTRGVMFLVPVLLLVVQWWLMDRCIDWVARLRKIHKPQKASSKPKVSS